MKLEKNIRSIPHWFFNDGSVPIQVRLISAPDIRKEKHLHRTMHEYFYVLKGNMELLVGNETIQMEQDDMAIVEPGEAHVVTDASEDLQLLLLMPPPVPNDKVNIP